MQVSRLQCERTFCSASDDIILIYIPCPELQRVIKPLGLAKNNDNIQLLMTLSRWHYW